MRRCFGKRRGECQLVLVVVKENWSTIVQQPRSFSIDFLAFFGLELSVLGVFFLGFPVDGLRLLDDSDGLDAV